MSKATPSNTLHLGDCLEVIKGMPDNSVDAVVTDPPYGLSFMGKAWDYDVPKAEVWREVLRVLKPGGHLLSFFGTRTYHRGVVQIEDAGFEIRDQIGWLYGSGFPKSLDVSKAIDKAAGATRETRPVDPARAGRLVNQSGDYETEAGWSAGNRKVTIDPPATDAARQWNGWGTNLKPAWEPIVLARKPLEGTVAANVLEHGTGAMNIDGCRVVTQDVITNHARSSDAAVSKGIYGDSAEQQTHQTSGQTLGRFPANLIHDGSNEVIAAFPNAPGQLAKSVDDGSDQENNVYSKMKHSGPSHTPQEEANKSASRFFYCAKASKKDRGTDSKHPTVKPTALMQYLCRLITPPNGVILDPFMGSGSTGKAALLEGFSFIGIEKDAAYYEIAKKRVEGEV